MAAALSALAVGAAAHEHPQRPVQRTALLQQAEAALSCGDAVTALHDFEIAAEQEHALDIEVGIVRSRMALGEYRRALAFAAHAAGGHQDEPEGASLYAALLRMGGQPEQAQRVLDEANQPMAVDARLAPASSGDAVPAAARVLGSGLLIDAAHALAPRAPFGDATSVWLRDGLGHTVRARFERSMGPLALLRLERPLEAQPIMLAPRDAFPGSPAHAVAYRAATVPEPALPTLHSGFLGMTHLGIEMGSSAQGGPVFDSQGRVIGVALTDTEGHGMLLPASSLRAFIGDSPASTAPRLPLDELYERALRITLQVIGR